MRKKEISLIGGAGYIGSVLSQFFLNKGFKVTCFDNLIYKNGAAILPLYSDENFKFVNSDLRDFSKFKEFLKQSSNIVLLAGLVGDPITKQYPDLSNSINLYGIKEFIDNLEYTDIEKLIFISTCSNYGLIKDDELADENFPLNPISLYSKAKVEIEKYILSLKGKISYAPTILRFATAFGLSSRMRFDLTVNEFTRALHLGEELLVYDPDTWRPYCHVMDFARLILNVINQKEENIRFEIFNAGGDKNNFTKRGIVEIISSYIERPKIKYQEFGPDPRNYRVNFEKLRERLNFEPKFSVENGVIEILNSLRSEVFNSFRVSAFISTYK